MTGNQTLALPMQPTVLLLNIDDFGGRVESFGLRVQPLMKSR